MDPPLPENAEPDDINTSPLSPCDDFPDPTVMSPLPPEDEVPDIIDNSPLTPNGPEFEVDIMRLPLEEDP